MPNFFQKLFSFGAKQPKNEVKTPFISLLSNQFTNMFSLMARDYLKAYRGWVFGCVTSIAQEVGNISIKLFEVGTDEDTEIHEHDLLDLLNRVNPQMTRFELFEITQSHLELEGNAFWLLARDGTGKVREIWPLRPDKVKLISEKENPLMIKGYLYTQRDGAKIPLEPNNVLHFKNFNADADFPFPYRGTGTVEAAAMAIDMSNFSHEWNKNFFENSAVPHAMITYKDELDPDDYERFLREWKQNYKGKENAHKVAILKDGVDVKTIGFNQKEMDFVEQMRFTRDEILALFRVPKTVLGIVEDVNRSNAEASNYVFALRTIKPKMQRIIDTLNEFLVPEFGENLFIDFDSPVPEDRAATITEYERGIDRWLTRNDIRTREGLVPTTQGNSIFGNFATAPIDSVPEAEKGTKPRHPKPRRRRNRREVSPNQTKEFIDKLFENAQKEETPEPEPKPKEIIKLSDEAKKNFKMLWHTKIEANSNPVAKDVRKYFDIQKEEVLANVERELKGLEPKEYSLKQFEDLLFDKEKAVSTAITLITPHLRKIVKEIGDEALILAGVQELINLDNPAIQAFFEDRAKYFANTITDRSIDVLQSEIADGIANGESIRQISERVENVYDEWDSTRATLIARTETSAASNFGAVEGYGQAGIEKIEWIVVSPEDEDCLSNENEIVEIGKAFPSGHTEPPAHPNCVCGTLPVIER